MDQQEAKYRLAAAECLERAALAQDPNTRAGLLAIAQKWLEMANLDRSDHRWWPQRLKAWLNGPSDSGTGKG